LQCEICGKEIIGKPRRVIVEGARLTVCSECAKLGSGYWEPETKEIRPAPKSTIKPPKVRVHTKAMNKPRGNIRRGLMIPSEHLEIVDGFGRLIKRAREKMGLTPEDLGKMIGEKESVIKKIEGEKMIPDIRLARKLEHALRIKLLTEIESSSKETLYQENPRREITLGEIVHLKGVRRGRSEKRGQ